jgi:hypothetical protein
MHWQRLLQLSAQKTPGQTIPAPPGSSQSFAKQQVQLLPRVLVAALPPVAEAGAWRPDTEQPQAAGASQLRAVMSSGPVNQPGEMRSAVPALPAAQSGQYCSTAGMGGSVRKGGGGASCYSSSAPLGGASVMAFGRSLSQGRCSGGGAEEAAPSGTIQATAAAAAGLRPHVFTAAGGVGQQGVLASPSSRSNSCNTRETPQELET